MRIVKLAGAASVLLAAHVFAQSTVRYTLELSPFKADYVSAWKNRAWASGQWTSSPAYFTADGTVNGAPLGNPADGQVFHVGDIITWDLVVEVDPNKEHQAPGGSGPGHGYAPCGLANLVFNLQLEDPNADPSDNVITWFGPGGSATSQGFFSAINDGTNGDPLAAAAFTLVYNITDPLYTSIHGPGRAIDSPGLASGSHQPPVGGPNLGGKDTQGRGTFCYPTVVGGKLLGQGCGYSTWFRSNTTKTVQTWAGVGMTQWRAYPSGTMQTGLGIKPICEGQINTMGMPPGVYRLRALPTRTPTSNTGGVNVLRGDVDLLNDVAPPAAFAVAANVVEEDTITFTLLPPQGTLTVTIEPSDAVAMGAQFAVDGGAWQNPGTINLSPGDHIVTFKPVEPYTTPDPQNVTITSGQNTSISVEYVVPQGPVITLAESWRTHGTAGSFAIPLNVGPGPASVECRVDTPASNPRIVITFDKEIVDPVTNPEMYVYADAGALPAPVVGTISSSGNKLTIPLSQATDKSCVTLGIGNVLATDGTYIVLQTIKLTYLKGDVDGDHRCGSSDLVWVKAKQNALIDVNASTFQYDLDCNGRCGSSDLVTVKSLQNALQTVTCDNP